MLEEVVSCEGYVRNNWLRTFSPKTLAPDDATIEELELHVAKLECAQGIDGLPAPLLEKLLLSLADACERLLKA